MVRFGYTTQNLALPASTNRTLYHDLNPGGLTLGEALNLSLPTWERRGAHPKLRLSSQDPVKQAGARAYAIQPADRR